MKNIALLINFHKDYTKINYFSKILKKIDIDYYFLIDESKEYFYSKFKSRKFDEKIFFPTKNKNVGKIFLMAEFAATNKNYKFLKSIDYDDSLFLKKLNSLEEQLSSIPDTSMVKHVSNKIYKKNKIIRKQYKSKILRRIQMYFGIDINYSTIVNANAIYPSKLIAELNDYKDVLIRCDLHDDVLLTNFCIGMGSEIAEVDYSFYIQFHGKGQSLKSYIEMADAYVTLFKNYEILSKNGLYLKKVKSLSKWIYTERTLSKILQGKISEKEYNERIKEIEQIWIRIENAKR